jgi:uncharacterized protein (DUF1919 family)
MKKRKHRFYIDVTYSKPVEYRLAAKGLILTLDNKLDLDANPVWAYDNSPYINKLVVTEKRS